MKCVYEELKGMDIAALTAEMVRIPSYSFMENQEDAISQYIVDFFQREGIEAYRYEIEPGRFNAVAILRGEAPTSGNSLMLSGHMDTVQAYDFAEAFEGRRDGEYVYGRGSCDMKGPLAAMMAAMAAIHRSGTKLKGDLVFCGVSDEEEMGIGAKAMIERGPMTSAAIIGEPTELRVAVGHKGIEWIEATFHGTKVHGASEEQGVNAIASASKFVCKIESEYKPVLRSRVHPLLGRPTINVGTIVGGDQPSTVPDLCKVRMDRRCIVGETIPQVYGELEAILEELHAEDPSFRGEIRDVFDGQTLPHEPFCTDAEEPIVRAAVKAVESRGVSGELTAFKAWADSGFMAAAGDCKCIVLGPGELSVAHSTREKVSIAEMNKAAEIYADIALQYCGC